MEFLLMMCLVLLFTKVAAQVCNGINIPSVIGELLVGICLGPALLGWISPDEFMHYFSEIGVILLMFIAGLESDLGLLKKYWRPAVTVALLGIFFPLFLGIETGIMFTFSTESAIFLGVLLSATSVSISVQVLKELQKLDTKEGATILGAAIVDDVLVVVLLGLMMSMMGPDISGGTLSLGSILLVKVLFFVCLAIVSKWGVPFVLAMGAKMRADEALIAFALVVCFGFAYIAEVSDMGAIIGSFFAGVAVAQTTYLDTINRKIMPIGYGLFIPMFFVSIGLNMTFGGLEKHVLFIVVVTSIAVVSKLVGGALGARITGFDRKGSLVIGAGMVSRGEMALIIAQMGLVSGFLSDVYYSPIILIIIATTILAPLLLKITIVRQAE